MATKVWCSDIYDLNSSNTTLNYEHDTLYREYAATSIGDLIDKMQDRLQELSDELDQANELNEINESNIYTANQAREKILEALTDSINLLDNAKDILNE